MIAGIGVDIVEIERIRKALSHGTKMIERVFTREEIGYCSDRIHHYQHFAGRFAAKEAALKALGTGWREGIRWKDVEVITDSGGQPRLRFHGRALEIFQASGATSPLVSITHGEAYAVAMVVLDGAMPPSEGDPAAR